MIKRCRIPRSASLAPPVDARGCADVARDPASPNEAAQRHDQGIEPAVLKTMARGLRQMKENVTERRLAEANSQPEKVARGSKQGYRDGHRSICAEIFIHLLAAFLVFSAFRPSGSYRRPSRQRRSTQREASRAQRLKSIFNC